MDMKKICCAVVLVAATISCVLAQTPTTAEMASGVVESVLAPAPGPAASAGEASATAGGAPGPAASGAAQTLQVFGSFVGAAFLSFLTYYMQY